MIVDKHNCCYSLSFKLSDLKYGLNNPIFENEPKREELCKWLSYCQFKLEEIKSGLAWKTINNFQIQPVSVFFISKKNYFWLLLS